MAQSCQCVLGRACPLCPGISDVDLFSYREGIIDLDAEVSDGAFDFDVAKQELHGPQVAGSTVDQRRLCSSQRMCAKKLWVEPDAGDPSGKESCVLPCRHALAEATPARE
jgi:hypothetical protein